MNFNTVAATAVITCSDTAVNGTSTTACQTTTTVADCDQYYCNQTDAATASHGCRRCASTKTGSGGVLANIGFPLCAGTVIANCDIANP